MGPRAGQKLFTLQTVAPKLPGLERTAPEPYPAELPLAARAPPARSRLR